MHARTRREYICTGQKVILHIQSQVQLQSHKACTYIHTHEHWRHCLFSAALTERQPKSSQIMRTHWRQAGLTLRALNVFTPNQSLHLCRDLTMSLQAGNSLLILGPSGCGKSSMLRAIAGIAAPPCLWQQSSCCHHQEQHLKGLFEWYGCLTMPFLFTWF
jgi:ABC-type transport system involved in cytochrome bd biosynthesis fused ATPase/permease subunit